MYTKLFVKWAKVKKRRQNGSLLWTDKMDPGNLRLAFPTSPSPTGNGEAIFCTLESHFVTVDRTVREVLL